MLNIKTIMVLVLAGLLSACGGSSKSDPLFEGGGGSGGSAGSGDTSDNTTPPPATDGDLSTGVIVGSPQLGINSGSNFQSGALALNLTDLSAGGNARIEVNIVDAENNNAKIVSQRYKVVFSSKCSEEPSPKAEFSNPTVLTSSGTATVAYTAKGCVGVDNITAQLYAEEGTEVLALAFGQVTVAPAEIGTISFVETTAPALSITTIANPVLPTSAQIVFQVKDVFDNPIEGVEVEFKLVNGSGGIHLPQESAITAANGQALATVNSGTAHTTFSVVASVVVEGKTISTSSQPLSVTTGIPSQERFSLSVSAFNPGAFNVDGVPVTLTVRAADTFGNYAPAGTIVNFTAESGGVNSFCRLDAQGACTVTWSSSGARPGGFAADLNRPNERIGMTTILAYTLGDAGFTDGNGNGVFDLGENYVMLSEPFRDDDWNQQHTANEFFHDTDNNNAFSVAGDKYQGALCSAEAKVEGHCETQVQIYQQLRIVQSLSTAPKIRLFNCLAANCTEGVPSLAAAGEFYVVLQDGNGNIPAAGTALSVSAEGYIISGDDGAVDNHTGELDGTERADGLSGLPEYGMLYRVSYREDTAGEGQLIELKASTGDNTRSVEIFR